MSTAANKEILFTTINFCYILHSLMRPNYMLENLTPTKTLVNERENT